MEKIDLDFDYYIYTSYERIARIVKTKRPYNIVRFPGVNTYSTNYIPDIPISELLFKYNFSRSKSTEEFYIPKGELDEAVLIKLKTLNVKIQYMEKFEAAVNVLKYAIIKRTADEDIYNRILMQQIEEYTREGKVGSLLKAEFECSRFSTIETLVEYIRLKYSDASEILAFIRYRTLDMDNCLKNGNIEKADEIINEIYKKYAL
jgi:hypothetical protein